jgi:hypothetical protein
MESHRSANPLFWTPAFAHIKAGDKRDHTGIKMQAGVLLLANLQ